jgi:hypothetical protein
MELFDFLNYLIILLFIFVYYEHYLMFSFFLFFISFLFIFDFGYNLVSEYSSLVLGVFHFIMQEFYSYDFSEKD